MTAEAEFVELATARSAALFRTALLLTGDWHTAEDLVQETLGKLYAHWPRVAGSSDPAAYARTTLIRTFLSSRRRRSSGERSMRGVEPPSVHDLVAVALRRRRSQWRSPAAGWAAAAAVAVGATALVVTSPWSDPPAGVAPADSPTSSTAPCHTTAREDVLPAWARVGFSDPEPVVMHATSDHGRIVAILFGRVLHAPPAETVNNKILWVARTRGADPLSIEAVHAGDGRTVHREVPGGPGPSIVDLPTAGCWHLTLQWGSEPERRDTMDLEYVDPG